jgi:hypothetical protein
VERVLDIRLALLKLDDDVFECRRAVSPNFLDLERFVQRAVIGHTFVFPRILSGQISRRT